MKFQHLVGIFAAILLSGVINGCIFKTETAITEQVVILSKDSAEPSAEQPLKASADALTDERTEIPVNDSTESVFEDQVQADLVQMTAVVKEGSLLVTSLEDQFPGAYYVYYGQLDTRGIRGGDKILIDWDGSVQETSPAQLYAEKLKKIQD